MPNRGKTRIWVASARTYPTLAKATTAGGRDRGRRQERPETGHADLILAQRPPLSLRLLLARSRTRAFTIGVSRLNAALISPAS
jgi:hypothetical protein